MKIMEKPLVSIIMATYNSENHIHHCLNSIQNLGSNLIELIIIDGNSTDQTLHIIQQYTALFPIIISEPDKGIYDALNKGSKLATGKWCYFIGSDDTLEPGFKAAMGELKDEQTLYYGSCITSNPNIFLGGKYSNYRLAKSNICHHAIFYPRNVFDTYSYELAYKVCADHVLNIKLWADTTYIKKFIPIVTAKFNLAGFHAQHKDLAFEKDRNQLILKHLGIWAYMRYQIKVIKSALK